MVGGAAVCVAALVVIAIYNYPATIPVGILWLVIFCCDLAEIASLVALMASVVTCLDDNYCTRFLFVTKALISGRC